MTGTSRTSAELDPRRRRMLVRAWRRGIREMDLILGGFADAELATLSEADLDMFETILNEDDGDLLKWVTGERPTPARLDTDFFRAIAAFRPSFDGAASDGSGQDRTRLDGVGRPMSGKDRPAR